jgi:hypothetical protein
MEKGNPIKQDRPLFNVEKLIGNDLPVLLLEGEKCASIPLEPIFQYHGLGGAMQSINPTSLHYQTVCDYLA